MVYLPFVVGAVASLIFVVLLARLRSVPMHQAKRQDGFDVEWFESFSAFRYLPMRRLLNGSDEAFLQTRQLGSNLSLRAFRAERRQLFRIYLQDLRSDFRRLSLGAKQAIVNAPTDQSHHVETLLALEWRFRKTLWRTEVALVLHACGWQVGDVSGLIDVVKHFEFSLREVFLAQSQEHA